MSFLKKNVKRKGQYLRKEDEIPDQTPGEDFITFLVYLLSVFTYFIKRNLNKFVMIPLFVILFSYLVYKKYLKEDRETEMIDGIEVPKLKDNYDLSID